MRPILAALQEQKWYLRWPIKLAVFAGIVFITLYPHPRTFVRHLQHIRHNEDLTRPDDPALAPFRSEFEGYTSREKVDVSDPHRLIQAVEKFVYLRVPYAWDWETWGVADYLPSLSEISAKGREDCDGRAVLAAALLRSFSMQAELVADLRHVWVRTPLGDLMHPLGPPLLRMTPGGLKVRWRALLDPAPPAFGVAVFPLIRELIILITAWALLLPPRISRTAAGLALLLLAESLLVIRMAGANPMAPNYLGLALAAVNWPVVAWILWRSRGTGSASAIGGEESNGSFVVNSVAGTEGTCRSMSR